MNRVGSVVLITRSVWIWYSITDYSGPTCWVTGVISVPVCWSSVVGTFALTWLFHWFLYSHWRHCWFKMTSIPWVTFSVFSLPPHDGHLWRNNWRRQFSFTITFPFICKCTALTKKQHKIEILWIYTNLMLNLQLS